VRGLQWPAPHINENLRHWCREGDKTGRCASREKEMQLSQTQPFEVLQSKPPGVLVETRWRIVLLINIFGFQLFDYGSDIILCSVQFTDICTT
jgi:hypothetical protein